MKASEFVQRCCRAIELRVRPFAAIRTLYYRCRGATIHGGTLLPKVVMTWPHQVEVGAGCVLEPDVCFKYDGPWRPGPSIKIGKNVFIGRATEFNITLGIEIGNDCLLAAGCFFIDADHGMQVSRPMNGQPGTAAPIRIEDNVWIGANSVVLKGVRIGGGSVVGAGSLVRRSIGEGELWAGVPAKFIRRLT